MGGRWFQCRGFDSVAFEIVDNVTDKLAENLDFDEGVFQT
jgi:hypothetical protein